MIILENQALDRVTARKQLLPKWLKIFGWLFIIAGALAPMYYCAALVLGFSGKFAILGLSYVGNAYAAAPAAISLTYLIHGVVAYGLLFGKNWGVISALILGYCGLMVAMTDTLVSSFNNINFEPIFILLYLYVLHQIQHKW